MTRAEMLGEAGTAHDVRHAEAGAERCGIGGTPRKFGVIITQMTVENTQKQQAGIPTLDSRRSTSMPPPREPMT